MNSLVIKDFTYISNKYMIPLFSFLPTERFLLLPGKPVKLAVISFCSVSVFFLFFFFNLTGIFKKKFYQENWECFISCNVGMTSKLPFNINTLFVLALLSLQVKNEGDDFGWGVVVNFSKKSNVKVNCCPESRIVYTFLVKCFFRIRKSIRLKIALP